MTMIPRRVTKPSPPIKIEPVQSTYDMHLTTLKKRFGEALLVSGFNGVPNVVADLAVDPEIGMTRTELLMWEKIIKHQRDSTPPWPAVGTIANDMYCSVRSVQRYIRRLEKKGLLDVIYSPRDEHGSRTNHYDFSPLYRKVIALYDKRKAAKLAAQSSQNEGDNFHDISGMKPPIELTQMGDNSSIRVGDNSVKNSTLNHPSNLSNTAKLEQQLEPQIPSNEESYKDSLGNRYDSRSRMPEKEAFDYTTSNVSNGYTNRPNSNEQPGNLRNTSYIDQDAEPDVTNENRENRNRTTESAGGAVNSVTSGSGAQQSVEAARFIVTLEAQQYIKNVMNIISSEMHDNEESYAPNISRLTNLYREFNHLFEDEYRFIEVVEEARLAAKKVANVTRRNKHGKPNRVPYFFKVLEDLLSQMHQSYLLSIRE